MGQLLHQALAQRDPSRYADCVRGDFEDFERDLALFRRAPAIYNASLARRRGYLSPRDADAYDRGVMDFQAGEPMEFYGNTPRATGWLDAQADFVRAQ